MKPLYRDNNVRQNINAGENKDTLVAVAFAVVAFVMWRFERQIPPRGGF